MWPSSVSVAQWVLMLHPQVLGFAQWCPIYGEVQVDLLVRGTGFGNNLCCYLDDIISIQVQSMCVLHS